MRYGASTDVRKSKKKVTTDYNEIQVDLVVKTQEGWSEKDAHQMTIHLIAEQHMHQELWHQKLYQSFAPRRRLSGGGLDQERG